jgi:glycosidase
MSLDGATLEGAMMHIAFTLSVRGIPQLYAGEEIAMQGKEDPDNRRDFPGGFPGDARNAFDAMGRTPNQQKMFEWTRTWIRLRAEHSAITQGRLIDLFYDDDAYVFARQDKNETVIIAINRADKEKRVPVGTIGLKDGAGLAALIGAMAGTNVTSGQATLTIPARTAVAYKLR